MTAGLGLRIGVCMAALTALTACMDGTGLPGLGGAGASGPVQPRAAETDVEAPEIVDLTAAGLWDGRPSLGGVWVAHPSVRDPERVRIISIATGATVEGALFRREREMPGPPIQVSAEAAAALGLLAGQPGELRLVALRRVPVADSPEVSASPPPPDGPRPKPRPTAPAAPDTAAASPPAAPDGDEDAIAVAARAVAAAEAAQAGAGADAQDAVPGALARPWLQLGTYTDEANAAEVADRTTASGLVVRVAGGSHDGKPIWRVLAGPAADRAAMRDLTRQAAALGFADAYPVAR